MCPRKHPLEGIKLSHSKVTLHPNVPRTVLVKLPPFLPKRVLLALHVFKKAKTTLYMFGEIACGIIRNIYLTFVPGF